MSEAHQPWRQVPTLVGRHVRLEPLAPGHAPDLARAAADGELWNLIMTGVPAPGQEAAYVDAALAKQATGDSMAFVVRDAAGTVVGTTRYYDIDTDVPRVEIGYTWYAKSVQRTPINTEAKLLLLSHAFDTLGCEAVGFQTSHLNTRSQAAIERLGAKLDGVLRAHMRHRDGSLRDTWSYSIVAAEWPAIRDRLQARLSEQGHG